MKAKNEKYMDEVKSTQFIRMLENMLMEESARHNRVINLLHLAESKIRANSFSEALKAIGEIEEIWTGKKF